VKWNDRSCWELRAFVQNHGGVPRVDCKKCPKKAVCIVVPAALSSNQNPVIKSYLSVHSKTRSNILNFDEDMCSFFGKARSRKTYFLFPKPDVACL
jgi:hypothetical protein